MYMHGHELHAMHFLLYAYLQTGQDEAAKQVVEQSKQILATAPTNGDDTGMLEYYGFAAAHFPALYDLEMRNWTDAAALQPAANASPHLQMITYWARTIASAHMGDVEATRRNAQKFDEAEEATRKSKYAYVLDGPNSARGEVHAWLAFAEKKNDEALQQMRQVADTQDKVGKAEVDIPAREMLADMLLELNQPEQALSEYEKSMKIDPNRFNGLAGAARAAELAHQPAKANSYYAQLLKNCDDGKHSDRPELRSAKMVLAKNGRIGPTKTPKKVSLPVAIQRHIRLLRHRVKIQIQGQKIPYCFRAAHGIIHQILVTQKADRDIRSLLEPCVGLLQVSLECRSHQVVFDEIRTPAAPQHLILRSEHFRQRPLHEDDFVVAACGNRHTEAGR